jgi:hypothetical protein
MQKVARRAFTTDLLGSLFTFSLVSSLAENSLLAGPVKPVAEKWVVELQHLSKSLLDGKTQPLEWQRGIESLLRGVELEDLLRAIDYQRLAKTTALPDDHESAEEISLARGRDLPGELSFTPYFYALKKGRAIVPHGHHNLATMHMILHGEARARHYDRVRDEAQHMIVRLTDDKVCGPGAVTTISDQKDNIHWFVALTEPVYMFNIGVHGIKKKQRSSGRDYLDAGRGEQLGGGLIRARKLDGAEAYRLYGKA